MPTSAPSSTDSKFDFASAYPNSTKVVVEGPQGVRVPMREVALAGGELPVRLDGLRDEGTGRWRYPGRRPTSPLSRRRQRGCV